MSEPYYWLLRILDGFLVKICICDFGCFLPPIYGASEKVGESHVSVYREMSIMFDRIRRPARACDGQRTATPASLVARRSAKRDSHWGMTTSGV